MEDSGEVECGCDEPQLPALPDTGGRVEAPYPSLCTAGSLTVEVKRQVKYFV